MYAPVIFIQSFLDLQIDESIGDNSLGSIRLGRCSGGLPPWSWSDS